MRRAFAVAVAVLTLPLTVLVAQPDAPRQVISFQPLSAVFGVYSAEYERAGGRAVSWGVGASYWNDNIVQGDYGLHYTSAEFKLRAYPAGVALTGFSIGAAVGLTSISGKDHFTRATESVGGPTVGVLVEYQWLLGLRKEWAFTLGTGAKAIIIDDKTTTVDFKARYSTARISVGYAFR